MRAMGLREIASGIGILASARKAPWLWSRVGGDAIDLALLGAALRAPRAERGRINAAIGAVGGVAVLDYLCARHVVRNGARVAVEQGAEARRSIAIQCTPDEAYRFWRDVENLPRFMTHLESVRATGPQRSHWVARGQAGARVEWDAEIVRDEPGRMIAWRTLPGADVDSSGSVRFERAPGGRGTLVSVEMRYRPPAGAAGGAAREGLRQGPGAADGDRPPAAQEHPRDGRGALQRGPVGTRAEPRCEDRRALSVEGDARVWRRAMKAACWYGKQDVRVEDVPEPRIVNQRDAIVRVTSTAICGSDLHLYNGLIPTLRSGDILGHEFMGDVVEVGSRVDDLAVGDRVVVPFPIACGRCFFCGTKLYSLCENSNPNAWMAKKLWGRSPAGIFGYSHMLGGFAGGQAQYVRVPFADVGPIKIPPEVPDEKALFLSDILPTGYMAAEQCGIEEGGTVAVWGCGPVGLFVILSAYLLGAERVIAIDRFPYRLEMARTKCGAETIDYESRTSATRSTR